MYRFHPLNNVLSPSVKMQASDASDQQRSWAITWQFPAVKRIAILNYPLLSSLILPVLVSSRTISGYYLQLSKRCIGFIASCSYVPGCSHWVTEVTYHKDCLRLSCCSLPKHYLRIPRYHLPEFSRTYT